MGRQSETRVGFDDVKESERFEAASKAFLIVKEHQSESDADDDDDEILDSPRIILAREATHFKQQKSKHKFSGDMPILVDEEDFVMCHGETWDLSDPLWDGIESHCLPGRSSYVNGWLRPSGFKLQDKVEIDGLISAPQYNGYVGKVVNEDIEGGRIGVEIILNSARKNLSLKPDHLTRVAGIGDGPFRMFSFAEFNPPDDDYIHEAIVVRESIAPFLEAYCASGRAESEGGISVFRELLVVTRRCESEGKVMIVQHVVC